MKYLLSCEKNCRKKVASSSKCASRLPPFPPFPHIPPSAVLGASGGGGGGVSSERHELKLPLGLPFGHPDRVGGVLRYLHDADGERRLISLVDMVSHYLSRGGKGRKGDNNKRGS